METSKLSFQENSDQDIIYAAIRDGLTSFRDAFQVTCRSSDQPHNQCGQCKACLVDSHIHAAKEWWSQTGDLARRRFLLALINRLKPDVLDHLVQILEPFVNAKDYTYTRNKFDAAPRLSTDSTHLTDNNDPVKRQEEATKLIVWFNHEDKYSQGSFILSILQWCQSHLIFTIALNVLSLKEMDSEDEDHRSDGNAHSRLRISSALSVPSSSASPLPPSVPILKRPKTTSSSSTRQKSAVSFASSAANINDSDTEQAAPSKRLPKHKDFIRQLPIYLAKTILSLLEPRTLDKCKLVSLYWKKMATEVEDENTMTRMLFDDMMLLQSSAALQCNPCFARDTLVPVPDLFRVNTGEKPSARKEPRNRNLSTWNKIYEASAIPTRLVLMEERNVYCGAYNVLLLKDDSDRHRIVHMSGESVVAVTSRDARVRFIDMLSAQERPMVLIGHAASVRCIVVQEDKKRIFTGSYDLTVRCWSLETGRVTKLYHGHERTVTCLAVFLDLIAAGGSDNLCLVWRYKYTRPWRTFKHKHPVSAVAISDDMTLSGDIQGKIKIWHILTGTLIKSIKHRLGITSVKFDKWHIASASHDSYASVWTANGTLNKPLCTFRHPKEVLCLEFLYLRLLTGCGDGKIRIWSIISGYCLRVMRGNSVSDPVTSLTATPNRILVNTKSSLLLMNFEPIKFDYTLEEDIAPGAKTPTPPILSASALKRRRISIKRRQSSASKVVVPKQAPVEEKKKEVTVLFDNENIGLDLSLEETKDLLKRQMRGGVDEKRKLVPEEFRTIQQSPFYRADKSQDDTVYAEHRPIPLTLIDRPPSSPSRFDLKTRLFRSPSQYQARSSKDSVPTPPETPISLFDIVHRPPSQNHVRIYRQNTGITLTIESSANKGDKSQPAPSTEPKPPPRPQTVPATYEVKRGNKIYKVVVGYVSPFTSPLQRKELHLKTDGEMNLVIQRIKQQQDEQRASKPQVWLGVASQSTLK